PPRSRAQLLSEIIAEIFLTLQTSLLVAGQESRAKLTTVSSTEKATQRPPFPKPVAAIKSTANNTADAVHYMAGTYCPKPDMTDTCHSTTGCEHPDAALRVAG